MVVNPFVNRTLSFVMNWKHGLSIALAAITIFPIRIVLTILNCVVTIGVANVVPLWPNGFSALLRWLIRFQLTLLGIWWVRINGKLAERNRAPIVISNHISLIEGMWLIFHTKAATLSAIENSQRFVIGQIAKSLDTMWVNRSERGGIAAQIAANAQKISGPRILVFPEGTCCNGQALATFRSGAFVSGVPIQPVAIRYNCTWFDPSWCSVGPGLFELIIRMMLTWYTEMEITYLPIHEKHENEIPQVYANRVRDSIANVLRIPTTEYSFDDVRLASLAQKMGAHPEIGLVEFTKFNRELKNRLTIEMALEEMRCYIHRGGKLSTNGFKTALMAV